MRFILSVASKYLVPKRRQLSVSIISLVSILVISLVVWLTIVFMSVTDGVRQNWLKQLITLNAPVQMTPTDAYYSSYFYKIDTLSANSGYSTRSIGEKLIASISDPYDPDYDMELPMNFPMPDRLADGSLKDPVKMGWDIAKTIKGARPKEYEIALGNLKLNLLRESEASGLESHFVSQVSYFANVDEENQQFQAMVMPPKADDLNNLLTALPAQNIAQFFEFIDLKSVATTDEYLPLTPNLYPQDGTLKGCAIVRDGEVSRVIIPQKEKDLKVVSSHYSEMGYQHKLVDLHFKDGQLIDNYDLITFDKGSSFKAKLVDNSANSAHHFHDVMLNVSGDVQGLLISGAVSMNHLEIADAKLHKNSPFWAYQSDVPVDSVLGDGVIISQSYLKNGVRIGDRGILSYFAPTPTSTQEQRMPIFVAGFYDPGFVSIGNRFSFVDPKVTSSLRGSVSISDQALGNGINIWVSNIKDAANVKAELQTALEKAGISKYWNVESYHDYEFVKPVLQQLSSDKTLFSLICLLILLVACSNIISMLILLVNDKKREIGILRSMGATPYQIASIFGVCGFCMGIFSCIIGALFAFFTMKNIDLLVNTLNFLQGHDMFQTAFFGSTLPTEVSWQATSFVLITTLILSIVAGLIPAIKASRVCPTITLRGE